MKNIIYLLFFLPAFLSAQNDIIDRLQGIVVKQDTLYYLDDTTIIDNGTPFNDTIISSTYLGDSLTARNTLYNQAWDLSNSYSGLFRKAFNRVDLNRNYNNAASLFLDLTGQTLVKENQVTQFEYYGGEYRISVIEPSAFLVDVIQLPSGALRMERQDDGTRYNFQPRNRRYFRVQIGGTWYDLHYQKDNLSGKRVYKSETLATGPNTITIVRQ